jgi:predicted lipid-binding transport protein (Tim44 family)
VIALPAELREAELLSDLRGHFVRLQAAWDAREVGALQALATPGMVAQICEGWSGSDASANRTDVVTLHAKLLGFEALGERYLATVEFSGLIRESAQSGAAPFRELWMLARSKSVTSEWKLARQQALL